MDKILFPGRFLMPIGVPGKELATANTTVLQFTYNTGAPLHLIPIFFFRFNDRNIIHIIGLNNLNTDKNSSLVLVVSPYADLFLRRG